MITHGDTYSLRGAQARARSHADAPAPRGVQVDAQVAAISERVATLEATVRRLDTLTADLEVELRELRRQASGQLVRSAPEPMAFKTEPSTQTRWFPGAMPRSGSALRASRSGSATTYSDEESHR